MRLPRSGICVGAEPGAVGNWMSVPTFMPIMEPCFDISERRIDLFCIIIQRPLVKVDDVAAKRTSAKLVRIKYVIPTICSLTHRTERCLDDGHGIRCQHRTCERLCKSGQTSKFTSTVAESTYSMASLNAVSIRLESAPRCNAAGMVVPFNFVMTI